MGAAKQRENREVKASTDKAEASKPNPNHKIRKHNKVDTQLGERSYVDQERLHDQDVLAVKHRQAARKSTEIIDSPRRTSRKEQLR